MERDIGIATVIYNHSTFKTSYMELFFYYFGVNITSKQILFGGGCMRNFIDIYINVLGGRFDVGISSASSIMSLFGYIKRVKNLFYNGFCSLFIYKNI